LQGGKSVSRVIPILITLDVHSYPETLQEIPLWIENTLSLFDSLSIKVTFLFPAIFAEQFSSHVRMIASKGHEIGCHGLTHGAEEVYSLMPYKKQRVILREAKKRIEEITSQETISFRAPVFKINADTIRALEENGFKADLSVNPQRLGIFSSDLMNIGWLYAPRKPYHPDFGNPFKRGKSCLWEIPQSAFIFPFISNTGIAFGGTFMKLFFNLLYLESKCQSNPIVYMFHIEDIFYRESKFRYKFKWRHLFPSRKDGFMFRYLFFNSKDSKKTIAQNINLLLRMKNSQGAKFVTVKDMLQML
jgi:hypothetical protein